MRYRRRVIRVIGMVVIAVALSAGIGAPSTGSKPPSPAPPQDAAPHAGWEEVGPGSASGGGINPAGGSPHRPSLAFAPDGALYAVWEAYDDWTALYQINVRRWSGTSWDEVGSGSASHGGISDTDFESGDASVAVAPDGAAYVAWFVDSAPPVVGHIYVRGWITSTWAELGDDSAQGHGIDDNWAYSVHPSLAVAPDGTPYVAWSDNDSGDYEIYVRRWNGSEWEEVGRDSAQGDGISDNDGWSGNASMAIAPDGTPYVAWSDDSSGDTEIYVRRWNGSKWKKVGDDSAEGGGISDNAGYSGYLSMAIAPENTPYVAWRDDSGGAWQVLVRRWNGSVWEAVGSGFEVSDAEGPARPLSMAIAPDGTPYVAWNDSDGDYEIYVRRWNGSAWEEASAGSASGGGVSDDGTGSFMPSLAIAPDGRPYVAWDHGGSPAIYVRRCTVCVLEHRMFLPLVVRAQ